MDERLSPILERLGLREREVVETVRRSEPSRTVKSTSANVIGRYPSRKMGVTIQFESHKNELAFILELEHDPDIIEYYDQPPPIPLTYRARNGRRLDVRHTPDFFVLAADWIGWVECKTEAELTQLAVKQPNRYARDDSGWRCPPGELHAAGWGFQYRLRSSAEIDWTVQRNVAFLEDFLRPDRLEIPRVQVDLVRALVGRHPGLPLRTVLELFEEHGIPSDRLYAMIVTDQIFVDLAAAPLSEPDRARLYPDRETAARCDPNPSTPTASDFEPNRTVIWDDRPLTILHRGDKTLWLEQADGRIVALSEKELERLIRAGHVTLPGRDDPPSVADPVRERLTRVTPGELAEATRRNETLRRTPEQISRRTRSRWKARLRKSEQETGEAFFGLIPETARRGNRTRRLPEATLALTERFIKERFENARQPNLRSVWAKLVVACQTEKLVAPSYETFRRMARARPRHLQTGARQGKRAAYADQPHVWELHLTTPRHGDRPFEIGHIDHTELDLELVCSLTGQNLGRPWLTLLTDAFSRRVLAFRLAFEPPSYRACMAVFRECVRRFQCLPTTLVTDAGPEFQSTYYDALLARFEIIKKI